MVHSTYSLYRFAMQVHGHIFYKQIMVFSILFYSNLDVTAQLHGTKKPNLNYSKSQLQVKFLDYLICLMCA